MFEKKDFKTKLNDEFKSNFKKDLMKMDLDTLTSITNNLDWMRDIIKQVNDLNKKFKENSSLNKEEIIKELQKEDDESQNNLSDLDRKKLKMDIKKQLFVLWWSVWGVILASTILSPAIFIEVWISYIWANIVLKWINRYKKSKLANIIVDNLTLNFSENEVKVETKEAV